MERDLDEEQSTGILLDISNPAVLTQLIGRSRDLTTSDDGEWELEDVLAPSIQETYDEGSDDETFLETIAQPLEEEEEDERAGDNDGHIWRDGAFIPNIPTFAPVHETGRAKLPGPQVDLPPMATPLDFLRLFITVETMQAIANETNRYAANFLRTANLKENSRFHAWEETTADELWAFFGLITAMGLIQIADLQEYWSTDPVYDLPFFSSSMFRDRFLSLLTFLHLNDNSNFVARGEPGHDPLFKIAPFLRSIEKSFFNNWYPTANVAIDEAMVAWRGNLSFRVYNPDKPDKFGVKIFQLCDSSNGYCCKLEFYTGKTTSSPKGATYDVVMRLIQPYLGCGHRLFLDNYYTAPVLLQDLLRANTPACGTVRLNRKGLADDMKKKKVVKRKGDEKVMNDGQMNHIKFMDRREVNILTTIHTDSKSNTGRRDRLTNDPQVKFDAVQDYNKYMGAVDRSDQMIQYSAFKRRTLKWWKKVFFHLFMLAELNAYLLYKAVKQGQRPMTHRIFRRELAKEMTSLFPIPKSRKRVNVNPEDSALRRLVARHFPNKVARPILNAITPGKKARPPTRLCVVCSTTTGKRKTANDGRKRKESTIECQDCNVGLCTTPCFELFHTQKDYKRASRRLQEPANEEHGIEETSL